MTDTVAPTPVKGASAFITGLGIAQICSWGSLYYSFPLIAASMEAELGWSKTAIYGAATFGLLLAALLAVPVGAAIDRGWGRMVMASASVVSGLLLIAWASVSELALFYAFAAGIGALQAATLYEPAFAVIARRAGPQGAREGITALTLWGGFASTVFVPLIQVLLDLYGWRGTLITLGAINIAVCASLYFAVIDPKADAHAMHHQADPGPTGAALRAALLQPVFWGLALAFTAYTVTFAAFIFHFYPMMLERGYDTATVVMAMALIGPAQVAGRLAVSIFAAGMSARRLGSIVVAAFPVAMATLAWAPPLFWVVGLAAILYGAANGIMTIVRGIAVPEMVSRDAYGTINGALAFPMAAAKSIAPLAAAWLWSVTGSYATVMQAIFAVSMVMVGAYWWTATRTRSQQALSHD